MNKLFKRKYFVQPPKVGLDNYEYFLDGYKSYSDYNYLKPGLSSYLKTEHFNKVLKLTKDYKNYNVIDFGCADGPFLPSLSKYFNSVLGIDNDPIRIKIASKLVDELEIQNVKLTCNEDIDMETLKSTLKDNYQILYLLETLEHVGDKNRLYESKIDFINSLFSLIDENGIIVISVPKMVGITFLLQRFGLSLLRLYKHPLSKKNLIKASFLNDTTDLEKEWDGGHLGFNHKKLEKHLKTNFKVIKKVNLLFQVVYLIQRH